MAIKSVWFITSGYPTRDDPKYAFIRPVVCELADHGVACTVIAPQSVSTYFVRKKKARPFEWRDYTEKGNEVKVIQPKYFSISSVKIAGYNLSQLFLSLCLRKTVKKLSQKPDIIYTHFWDNALLAASIIEDGIPVLCVSGESRIRVLDKYPYRVISRYLPKIKALIAVSTKNLNESKDCGLVIKGMKTFVVPNAVNPTEFYKMDKNSVRKDLGIPEKEIVVAFVGAFNDRKGVLRVVEAVEKVDGVKLVLIGSGELTPNSNRIIFCGSLPHAEIVNYLNACDVFVLPTKAEGCCNAIIEAMACGLPIISSDLPFNYDILDNSCAILIDPIDIEQIARTINVIATDHPIREQLSRAALLKASSLTIQKRAERILKIMEKTIS